MTILLLEKLYNSFRDRFPKISILAWFTPYTCGMSDHGLAHHDLKTRRPHQLREDNSFYPEKLVKETLITGLYSHFYPDLRKLDLRGIFALTC